MSNRQGSKVFVKQKCNSSSTVQQTRILSSNVFGRKEKRGLSSSPGLKSTKYIYRNNPFQNGKSRHAKISHKPWRLHDKLRLDKRLSVCPNSSGISKIPSIYLAKQSLPIQSDALWTKCSSQGIHEAIKTGCSLASRPGNPSHHILRRHSGNGFLCGISKTTQTNICLLESLGLMINYDKSMLIPTQKIQFLGLLVDSTQMLFILPETKTTSIRKACQQLVNKQRPTVREVSRVLGLLEFCRPAVWSAPLHYRQFQELQISSLRRWSDYDQQILLTRPAKADLLWWINNLHLLKGSRILPPTADITITSDASKMGWGASMGTLTTGGKWSQVEAQEHINILELKAAFFALKSFLKDKINQVICLKLDNTTAVAYLNNMGGTHCPQLLRLTLEIWEWCEKKNVFLLAQHIPGVNNTVADVESRATRDWNDWKLKSDVILPLITECQINLFASRLRNIHGCLYNQLEQHDSIYLSSVQSHPCSPAQSESRECDPGVSSSTLVGPTVLASVDRNVDRLPSVLGKQQGTPDGHVESGSIPPTIPHAQVSRVENIRGQFASTGLSNTAVELLSNSVKASTAKSYNCSWTIWSRLV